MPIETDARRCSRSALPRIAYRKDTTSTTKAAPMREPVSIVSDWSAVIAPPPNIVSEATATGEPLITNIAPSQPKPSVDAMLSVSVEPRSRSPSGAAPSFITAIAEMNSHSANAAISTRRRRPKGRGVSCGASEEVGPWGVYTRSEAASDVTSGPAAGMRESIAIGPLYPAIADPENRNHEYVGYAGSMTKQPITAPQAPAGLDEQPAALPAPHAQAYVDPRHYRTFLAVVEHRGRLSAAARELGMSQPGVTHQLNELERRLGVPVLDRGRGRPARLTRAGRVFERYARSMVGLHAAMQSDLEQMARGIGGHLRVGASPGPGEHWLPPLLCAFREEYPDLHIELHVADARSIVDQVFEGDLELACVGGRWSRAGIRFEPVWRDDFVLVAAPTNPLAARGQLRLDDLAGIPFIAQEPGTGLRATFEHELAERGLTLGYFNVLAELGNQESVKSAVAAGWGVGCVWKRSIAAELALGTLVILDVEGFHPDSDYYMVRRGSRRLSRRSQALADYLLLARAQQAEQLRADGEEPASEPGAAQRSS